MMRERRLHGGLEEEQAGERIEGAYNRTEKG